MIFFCIALAVLVLFLVGFLIFSYSIFLRVCRRTSEKDDTFENNFSAQKIACMTAERLMADYQWYGENMTENVFITSDDGLKLCASILSADKSQYPVSKGTVVMLHGYRSSAKRNLCLQVRMLHDAGYDLLVADQRSHGRSEGKYICYGAKERFDAVLWCKKASEIFGENAPICLMGISMGGATVLMASPLVKRKNIRCVIADCPFASPWDIVSHVLITRHRIRPMPVLIFINLWCRLLAKFGLRECSSASSAAASSLPVLLLHGEADDYVPPEFSVEIKNSAPQRVQLIMFSGAGHTECMYYDEKKYADSVFSFLDENMK